MRRNIYHGMHMHKCNFKTIKKKQCPRFRGKPFVYLAHQCKNNNSFKGVGRMSCWESLHMIFILFTFSIFSGQQ